MCVLSSPKADHLPASESEKKKCLQKHPNTNCDTCICQVLWNLDQHKEGSSRQISPETAVCVLKGHQ